MKHTSLNKYQLFQVLNVVLFVWGRGRLLWIQIGPGVPVSSMLKGWGSWAWWQTPLTSAQRRQRQVSLCELRTSLVYIVSSRPARAIE